MFIGLGVKNVNINIKNLIFTKSQTCVLILQALLLYSHLI